MRRSQSQEDRKHAQFQASLRPGQTTLSREDLTVFLTKLHVPPSRIDEIFEKVDVNHDGTIEYEEFSAYVDAHEASLRTAFVAIDKDGSGSISKDEIRHLLDRMHMAVSRAHLDEIVAAIDTDGDGSISFDEFHAAFALLDPVDLLRLLDDSSSFSDETASMVSDLFKIGSGGSKASLQRLPSIASPATAKATAKPSLAAQLIPGGLAGVVAQTCVQPVETLKVRLQAEAAGAEPPRYKTMLNALRLVTAEEGVLALWKGMAPSAARELSYSTLRFGLYKPIKQALGAGTPRDTPLWKMMLAGGAAGGIASAVANPTDLLKTRMQADTSKNPKSLVGHARDILSAGGIAGFWRGASTTIARAVTLGAVKMASYDSAKVAVEEKGGLRQGSAPNTVAASFITAANVVVCSAPVDFLRTQVMMGDGSKGMFAIASEAIRKEGPLVLWRGWLPQYMRILPYGTLQFIFMEKIAAAMGFAAT